MEASNWCRLYPHEFEEIPNLPFARWSEVFLDPTAAAAVIDRIVHHATVLQTSGSSFRLQAAKRNQAPALAKEETR